MNYLIDSHVFLWLLYAPGSVGPIARQKLLEADEIFVSSISLWELTLKYAIGKLPHEPEELTSGVTALKAAVLPIRDAHLIALPSVKLNHGDPFDTMLIAQSVAEGMQFVTADRALLNDVSSTLPARN